MKEKIRELIDGLDTGNYQKRIEFGEMLAAYGKSATPFLIEGLKHDAWMVRQDCADLLGKLRAAEAESALIEALDDDEAGVRKCAGDAIHKIIDSGCFMEKAIAIASFLVEKALFATEGAAPSGIAAQIALMDGGSTYASSVTVAGGTVYLLRKIKRGGRRLACFSLSPDPAPGFRGVVSALTVPGETVYVKDCPASQANADMLRKVFPYTAPVPLGLKTSFGMGDRMGIATPGHIRCAKKYKVMPILAQQSIREMDRTGRSPRQVMDDACWAVFQEGYRGGFGADADHLKKPEDIAITAAAGFTFFTVDPSDHLVLAADDMDAAELDSRFDALFDSDPRSRSEIIARYSVPFDIHDAKTSSTFTFPAFSEDAIKRMAVKHLGAIRHTIKMHGTLVEIFGDTSKFDFEISIDETLLPTSPEEHLFIANEYKIAGVQAQSMAPRYVGEFQKGIDYIGDIEKFREDLQYHAVIARAFGPYKLSIHSGSDKFSVFPIFGELTGGLLHEKTAGTSYLEAIRVIARHAPALYREIHAFAFERFETDRASYHVTTNLAAIRPLDSVTDDMLPAYLDEIDARQLIHITYGSVLTVRDNDGKFVFYDRVMDVLDEHEEDYYDLLDRHFSHHCDTLLLEKA